MDVISQYCQALWRVYHKTRNAAKRAQLRHEERQVVAKLLWETRRLCEMACRQRDDWARGARRTYPIDPYRIRHPDIELTYTLSGFPHMAPEIKRFMDRSAVQYVRIFGRHTLRD